MDVRDPLAMLGEGANVGWQPQAPGTDVSWLSRVNADIERARRAGRQRGGAQAQFVTGRIADPMVRQMRA